MQQTSPHTTHTQPKRRAKAPLEITLTGPVGELVAAEFEYLRGQIDRLEKIVTNQNELMMQITKNTQYPISIYTEDDFTAMFGLKQRAQQDYRKKGKLDYLKLGEKVLYTQQHIDEFIARHDSLNMKKD